jgi:DNA-binding MarR family transcriptional regulator
MYLQVAGGSLKSTESDDVRRALDAVRNLVRALRLSDRETERQHGISAAQMFVLHEIASSKAISMRELAERTATDQSSVSAVVRKLEDAGLIERRWAADDARRAELSATADGKRLLRKSVATAQQRLLSLIRELPAERRRQLARTLETIVEGMGAQGAAPPMLFEDESAPRKKV